MTTQLYNQLMEAIAGAQTEQEMRQIAQQMRPLPQDQDKADLAQQFAVKWVECAGK